MRSLTAFEKYSDPVPVEDADVTEHVFKEGETLSALAHLYYGDRALWKDLASYNRVTDPRRVEVGARLLIPPRPLRPGAFESV